MILILLKRGKIFTRIAASLVYSSNITNFNEVVSGCT